jgi:hypothetical protein
MTPQAPAKSTESRQARMMRLRRQGLCEVIGIIELPPRPYRVVSL